MHIKFTLFSLLHFSSLDKMQHHWLNKIQQLLGQNNPQPKCSNSLGQLKIPITFIFTPPWFLAWYHSQILIEAIMVYLNSQSKSAGNGFLPFWTNEHCWYVLLDLCKNLKVSQNNSKTWNVATLSFWKHAQIRVQPWRGPRLYLFHGHNYNVISIPLVLQGETVLHS